MREEDRGTSELLPNWVGSRFVALELLGEGGFGRVVLARDPNLDRQVAIKVLAQRLDGSTEIERFRREARITASVRHPGLVTVYDFEVDDEGRAFIVYEFLPGRSLRAAIELGPRPGFDQVAGYGVRLAEALAELHGQGILHRDVKPDNVLLDEGGEPVLCDLGIALSPENQGRLTASGTILGTPAYLAPELWRGQPASGRSDQFSLAATLYDVAFGHGVYPSDDVGEIVRFLAGGAPLPLACPSSREGKRLVAALARALSLDPAERYPDVADLGAALLADGSSPPGAAATTRRLRAASLPDAGAPPSWRSPAAVLGTVLLVGVGLAWGSSAAPSTDPTPRVRPTVPEESRAPASTEESLREICRKMGYGDVPEPVAALEILLRRVEESDQGEEAERRVRALPPSPLRSYLLLSRHGALRDTEELIRLSREVDLRAAAEDLVQGLVQSQATGFLIRHIAKGHRSPTEKELEELRREHAAFTENLRALPDGPGSRLRRAMHWEWMARCSSGYPNWNLRAFDEARRHFLALGRDLAAVPPALRPRVLHSLLWCLRPLGEGRLAEELLAAGAHAAAREVVRDDYLLGLWEQEWEEAGLPHVQGLAELSGELVFSNDPDWLFLPPGSYGSVSGFERLARPILAPRDSPAAPLPFPARGTARETFLRAAEDARLGGRQMVLGDAWYPWLAKAVRRPGPRILGALLRDPLTLLRLGPHLAGRKGPDGYGALLGAAERLRREVDYFRPRRRIWYQGARGALLEEVMGRRLESGDRAGAQQLALEILRNLEGSFPPWTRVEVRLASVAWEILAGTETDTLCEVARKEAVRLSGRVHQAWATDDPEARSRTSNRAARVDRVLELMTRAGSREVCPADLPDPEKIIPESAFPVPTGGAAFDLHEIMQTVR